MDAHFTDPSKLNHAVAFRAYRGSSLDPAKLARDAQDTFAREVNELHDELMAAATTDAERKAVTEQMERYEKNYLFNITAYLKARAGLGNAPEREAAAESAHAEAQAKLEAFQAWRDRAGDKIREEVAIAASPFVPVAQGDGFAILVSEPAGRAQIKFDAKPADELRASLKDAGWHWTPGRSAWEQDHSDEVVAAAKAILGVQEPEMGFAARETARRGSSTARGRA